MFVDMIDSVSVTRDMDPEEADAFFRRAHALMREAVSLCSGRIARRLGDGVMALFGAPVALEDHAVQACHAALRLLEMGSRVRATSPDFRFRIGIHSGLVVLGRSATDFGLEYEPAGTAVAIAARLQNLAAPNTAVITEATRQLLRGRVQATPLGRRDLKGLEEPLKIFRIGHASADQTSQTSLAETGEPFVNRSAELAALTSAMAAAAGGSGRAMIVLGEAGVGKTRLLHEFARAQRGVARVLRASAERYTAQSPFHSVRRILEALFEVDSQDRAVCRARIAMRLEALGLSNSELQVPIDDLLELTPAPHDWELLSPPVRDGITLSAIHSVLAAESADRPLAIVLDDAHWLDSASIRLLRFLLPDLRRLRILLLVSARPGFDPDFGQIGGESPRLLSLDRLDRVQTDRLNELLIGAKVSARLRDVLFTWSLGNPLFVHETVHALVDGGYLVGPPGDRELVHEPQNLQPPASVAAIIGERIDRLTSDLRNLLRAASILGMRFSVSALAATISESPDVLRYRLDRLAAEDFLRLERREPEPEFAFRHALFQEVCYTSLLRSRRRELHAAAFAALWQSADHDRDGSVEQLANHALRGGCWEEALSLCREAGQRAVYRSAHREAVRHFEAAIEALTELDPTEMRLAEAIDLRLELRGAYVPLLRLDAVGRILDDVERLAARLGDKPRQMRIAGFQAGHAYLSGSSRAAEELAVIALGLAQEAQDASLEIAPRLWLGMACHALGQLQRSVAALERGLALLTEIDPKARLGLPGRPAILLSCWVALSSAELGAFDAAERALAHAAGHLRTSPQPFELVYVHASRGFMLMKRGDFDGACRESGEALTISEDRDLPFMMPVVATQLGWLLTTLGHHGEGLALVRRGVQTAVDLGIVAGHSRWEARLADALFVVGDAEQASVHAQQALDIAERSGEELYACYAMALKAKAEFALSGALEPAQTILARAMDRARRLSLGPFVAKCQYELAQVQRAGRREDAAIASLAAALDGFRRYRMSEWVGRVAGEAG